MKSRPTLPKNPSHSPSSSKSFIFVELNCPNYPVSQIVRTFFTVYQPKRACFDSQHRLSDPSRSKHCGVHGQDVHCRTRCSRPPLFPGTPSRSVTAWAWLYLTVGSPAILISSKDSFRFGFFFFSFFWGVEMSPSRRPLIFERLPLVKDGEFENSVHDARCAMREGGWTIQKRPGAVDTLLTLYALTGAEP